MNYHTFAEYAMNTCLMLAMAALVFSAINCGTGEDDG